MGLCMVNIGIIGCGGIAQGHLYRLMNIEDVNIIAFTDIDLNKAKNFRRRVYRKHFSGDEHVYRDFREMIDMENLDAVCIFTPHVYHYEQAYYSLKKGLHVLVEKPMVCTVRQAEKLLEIAEKNSRVLLVSYQRHYDPRYVFAKNLIKSGGIGEIKQISIWLAQGWKKLATGKWRMDPSISCGGMLMDSGSHIIDILLWLVELDPLEIYAYVDNEDVKVDLHTNILVRFEKNVFASITINGNAVKWGEEETIWGTAGTILISTGDVMYQDIDGNWIKPSKLPLSSNPDQNFINCILGREENMSPGICGLNVIRFTEAVYRSARENRPVRINEISN